jgi:organic hydroperoxide reductase OsmC/OhrA
MKTQQWATWNVTQIRDRHDRSHHQCFIANSVRTEITVLERAT